jgi:hypothetical protein
MQKAFPQATECKESDEKGVSGLELKSPSKEISRAVLEFVESSLPDGVRGWKCFRVKINLSDNDGSKWKGVLAEKYGRVSLTRLMEGGHVWVWQVGNDIVASLFDIPEKQLTCIFWSSVLQDGDKRAVAEKMEKEARQEDFRGAKWGMSPAQVRETERKKPDDESQTGAKMNLYYHDTISGLPSDVLYIFAYDELVRAKYLLRVKHSNDNEYIRDYDKLSEALMEKYGSPKSKDVVWKNDLYKEDPQHWGIAVALGHAVFYTTWETSATVIFLYLDGDNFKIDFGIEYASKALKSLEDKADKEKERGKL